MSSCEFKLVCGWMLASIPRNADRVEGVSSGAACGRVRTNTDAEQPWPHGPSSCGATEHGWIREGMWMAGMIQEGGR
eukprot:1160685-Rhodomonas_salina.1